MHHLQASDLLSLEVAELNPVLDVRNQSAEVAVDLDALRQNLAVARAAAGRPRR